MGFQTPQYDLAKYLEWTTTGLLQLPDFQREYKWDDERIRSLLVTILSGHPLGVVMLLETGNDQIRFKPRPIAGVTVPDGVEPELLLLDGQQRLTSLTQALTGAGLVDTTDSRGKKIKRRYFIDMVLGLESDDRIDEAVVSIDADGKRKENFGKDVVLDVSTAPLQRKLGLFPANLLLASEGVNWLFDYPDKDVARRFHEQVVQVARTYQIPAIRLDKTTKKAAVATVFEKVNTGGLPLNVFELLTATFAGDKEYFDAHGKDFRLNDDWAETRERFAAHPVLAGIENTDFLQAATLLTTRALSLEHSGPKAPAISARREDILKLTLADYLQWREPLREAFLWAADFLADRHIFTAEMVPYPKQLVPLVALKVVMGADADLLGVSERLVRWFWCGILGELYGGAIETRFVWDLTEVPAWARQEPEALTPRTVREASFAESRLHSLRTRQSAAYKGIYALLLDNGARDWMKDKALDKVQYSTLKADIRHIFPRRWCDHAGIDVERRDSIVNKTVIAADTNRSIGGVAPSRYLELIQTRAGIDDGRLDALLDSHLVTARWLRADHFDGFFEDRRERLCRLVEGAMSKEVQRDIAAGEAAESSEQFEAEALEELVFAYPQEAWPDGDLES
jgi:hypothetical protein